MPSLKEAKRVLFLDERPFSADQSENSNITLFWHFTLQPPIPPSKLRTQSSLTLAFTSLTNYSIPVSNRHARMRTYFFICSDPQRDKWGKGSIFERKWHKISCFQSFGSEYCLHFLPLLHQSDLAIVDDHVLNGGAGGKLRPGMPFGGGSLALHGRGRKDTVSVFADAIPHGLTSLMRIKLFDWKVAHRNNARDIKY